MKYRFYCKSDKNEETVGIFECPPCSDPVEMGALVKQLDLKEFKKLYFVKRY